MNWRGYFKTAGRTLHMCDDIHRIQFGEGTGGSRFPGRGDGGDVEDGTNVVGGVGMVADGGRTREG